MTLPEAQEMLAAIHAAKLAAVRNGGLASYSINGRSKTVDLKWLDEQERKAMAVINSYQTGMFHAARFRIPE